MYRNQRRFGDVGHRRDGATLARAAAATTPADMSHDAFPFASSQEIELGFANVRASRISFVGELGWELYVPTEFTLGVYDARSSPPARNSALSTPATMH